MHLLDFFILALAAPTANDRSVEPIAVEAPPAPAPAPAPEPAPTGTIDPFQPPTASPTDPAVQPISFTAPPPPPPPEVKRPDRPIRWRVDIVGALHGELRRDPAWRAFDTDRLVTQPGFGLRADFRLASGRVFLGGGLDYRRSTSHGAIDGTLSTTLRVREPIAFARVSIVTVEGVDVFVQAGGGPSIVDMNFYSGQFATQRSVLGVVDGLAGLSVYLPKRWLPRRGASRLTAGLELGAGYVWRSKLDVRPQLTAEDDPIAGTTAPLGDVALRGFAWRLALFLRFQ